MAQIFSFDGVIPVVDPSAYVHPAATLIGDVLIGPACYVGPGAVLRGDFGRIQLLAGANFQDNCVAHSFPDAEVLVEEEGHIGHGTILHGCRVGKNAMVGMNSVVMDRVVIGENAIIGAMSFLKASMEIPAGHLALGSPASVVRPLKPEEIAWKREGTLVYQRLALESRNSTKQVAEPLTRPEANRKRVLAPKYDPLFIARLKQDAGMSAGMHSHAE
ncbi:MAG: transferase hexapeptide repeat family protein [Advenella sp.]|uniref:acyltransferase n=1 Tax=Advenella sp. TaxID=1872388 RepID=UPI00258ED50E|nr:transferase hexapeptide repeat family protein [Advenella sp.]MDD3757166.1 transferase hexapeptide repeat family protein [Advenella sp.]